MTFIKTTLRTKTKFIKNHLNFIQITVIAILISLNTLQITEWWYAFEFKTYQFRAVCKIRSISAGKVYFIIIIWFDSVSLYLCMCVCIWRGHFMFLTIHGPKWDQPISITSIFLASGRLILIAYSIFSLYRNTKIIHSIMMIWQNNFIESNYNWRRALRKILEEQRTYFHINEDIDS